jgi:hypothetical protein
MGFRPNVGGRDRSVDGEQKPRVLSVPTIPSQQNSPRLPIISAASRHVCNRIQFPMSMLFARAQPMYRLQGFGGRSIGDARSQIASVSGIARQG